MLRKGVLLVEKQTAMRERQVPVSLPATISPPALGRHYSVKEVAELWNLSEDKVREIFEAEPGVVVLGNEPRRYKRRYVTLRIPEPVLERVHRKISNV